MSILNSIFCYSSRFFDVEVRDPPPRLHRIHADAYSTQIKRRLVARIDESAFLHPDHELQFRFARNIEDALIEFSAAQVQIRVGDDQRRGRCADSIFEHLGRIDDFDPQLIQYVSVFVPKASGEHFNPHVTTGVGLRTYLDAMLAEPFEPFRFSFSGAAVYQLGQFGTAARKLKAWD